MVNIAKIITKTEIKMKAIYKKKIRLIKLQKLNTIK